MVERIDEKSLEWRGNTPVSSRFGDVYYSEDHGLEETEFVFLKGIGAPTCWQNKSSFVIAETGFGTGLNFLATYRAWLNSGATGTLTFISTENFPLSAAALRKTHKTFPELENFSKELCAAWPPPSPGFHVRSFANNKIQLLLMFGDATDSFNNLHASVDAWYLDGFSPSKNPEMWTDELFGQMKRLSKPTAKFATFTAAGFVKRALRERGFNVTKAPGYGRKRERLIGTMAPQTSETIPFVSALPIVPSWASIPDSPKEKDTLIIGAGIAGSSLAHLLHQKGQKVSLVTGKSPAGSDVPAAILSPGFQRSSLPASYFATSCFAHACWYPPYAKAWAAERGVKVSSLDPLERDRLHEIAQLFGWGDDWLETMKDGLYLPKSGALSPSMALQALQKSIPVQYGTVKTIQNHEGQWHIDVDGKRLTASNLVIACAMNSDLILGEDHHLELRAKPGQIEVVAADQNGLPEGNHAFGGYITAPTGAATDETLEGKIRTIGSTFEVSPTDPHVWPTATRENSLANLLALKKAMGAAPSISAITTSWAGIRATTPDYMPYVGPIPAWTIAAEQFSSLAKDRKLKGLGPMPYQKGLYIVTGFGAKGFQQAPLCAAYIAALLCGEPLPLPLSLIKYLHPARHMIKSIVRRTKP